MCIFKLQAGYSHGLHAELYNGFVSEWVKYQLVSTAGKLGDLPGVTLTSPAVLLLFIIIIYGI